MARLQEFYRETMVPKLVEQFGYKSVMEVPRIQKITLNMGLGEAVADKKIIEHAVGDMTKIAGQKPVITKARKAIAAFTACSSLTTPAGTGRANRWAGRPSDSRRPTPRSSLRSASPAGPHRRSPS